MCSPRVLTNISTGRPHLCIISFLTHSVTSRRLPTAGKGPISNPNDFFVLPMRWTQKCLLWLCNSEPRTQLQLSFRMIVELIPPVEMMHVRRITQLGFKARAKPIRERRRNASRSAVDLADDLCCWETYFSPKSSTGARRRTLAGANRNTLPGARGKTTCQVVERRESLDSAPAIDYLCISRCGTSGSHRFVHTTYENFISGRDWWLSQSFAHQSTPFSGFSGSWVRCCRPFASLSYCPWSMWWAVSVGCARSELFFLEFKKYLKVGSTPLVPVRLSV